MANPARGFAALLALSLAACDDDPVTVSRLTPAEVAGSYEICTLRFRPDNAIFPVADLLTGVMDTTPAAGRPRPSLAISATVPQFDLVYTRQSDGFLQQLRGTVSLGSATVSPRFFEDNPGAVASEALLPSTAAFTFATGPRRLTATTPGYTVRRGDYAVAAGISENGLQDRVAGRLEAVMQVGGCP